MVIWQLLVSRTHAVFANHAHVSAVIVVGRGIQAPSLRRTCSVLGRRRETDSLPNDATFAPALIPCRPAMSPASKKQHQYVCAHRNRVYVGIHTESLPQRTPHRLARTAVINHTNLRGATWWHEIQRNEPTRKHWFACAHTLHLRDVVLRRASPPSAPRSDAREYAVSQNKKTVIFSANTLVGLDAGFNGYNGKSKPTTYIPPYIYQSPAQGLSDTVRMSGIALIDFFLLRL